MKNRRDGGWREHLQELAGAPSKVVRLNERFPLTRFDQLQVSTKTSHLIQRVIPYPGLVVSWGPPKSGKSFTKFDQAMHIAVGWQYRGLRVMQGPVVYCAFEGGSGFGARAAGWRWQHRHDLEDYQGPIPFYLQPLRMDLVKDYKALIQSIRAQIEDPVMVVLDTLNRSFVGSESRDEDMSAYVSAADAIREAFECTVDIVHHSGIDANRPRGHTSLTGACEAQLSIKRDDKNNVVMRVEFMKDGPDGPDGVMIASRLKPMTVGKDENGDDITTCIVEALDDYKPGANLSPLAEKVRQALKEATAKNNGPVDEETWRKAAYRKKISKGDTRAQQKAFKSGFDEMINKGFTIREGSLYDLSK